MNKMNIEFIKTREDVISPERANSTDSGIDFFIPDDIIIMPGQNVKIPLGIKVNLPEGYDLTFMNKSGIASKKGLVTGACLVDNGYNGELILNLISLHTFEVCLNKGEKVIQGVVRKVETPTFKEVEVFSEEDNSGRGEDGFGSSGLFANLNKEYDEG